MTTYNYYATSQASISHFDVQVEVNGRPVKKHYKDGKVFVESRKGTKYTIKVKNNGFYRGLAIVSVDGLDVVSGKEASSADSGYIIEPLSTLEVSGYRLNENEVASFVFSEKGKSYTKQITGSSQNAGVIGVRIYSEKFIYNNYNTTTVQHPLITHAIDNSEYSLNFPYTTCTTACSSDVISYSNLNHLVAGGQSISATSATSNAAHGGAQRSLSNTVQAPSFDHGTSWGTKQHDKVITTSFERGNLLGDIIIYYSSRKSLENIGIEFEKKKKISYKTMPSAFGEKVYCKPPAGWTG